MPQFNPGEAKIARAPITVSPAGLNCQAEVFLGPDDMTKVATSGMIPFVSTGASQNVLLTVVMPAATGSYHVYVDIYAGGILIAAYQAIEDVLIGALAPPTGEILEVSWSEDGASWHPLTEPIPAYTYLTYRFRVKNTGASRAGFRTGYTYYSDFGEQWYWVYSSPEIAPTPGPVVLVDIEPGMEGNVDWFLTSGPGTWTITFYLFADDGVGGPEGTPGDALDSITVTFTTFWG